MNGQKTYWVAALTIVYAVSGGLLGNIEWSLAIPMILAALGVGSGRHALQKLINAVLSR